MVDFSARNAVKYSILSCRQDRCMKGQIRCRTRQMQKKTGWMHEAGQMRCRTGQIQERSVAVQNIQRTGHMKNRKEAVQDGCRTG